jgi:hypothetical protein
MPGLKRRLSRLAEQARLLGAARQVRRSEVPSEGVPPVVFFNASTRLSGLSQNAGFALIASWAVRLAGVPVVHFACRRGMSRCVLGTDEGDQARPMPCGMCIRQSRVAFSGAVTYWFEHQPDAALAAALQGLSLDELLSYECRLPDGSGTFPLGAVVLPSLRWRMRLQSLADDEATRSVCREFMLSAWNILRAWSACLEQVKPQAAVLFNGIHFPEATAAWLCARRGIRVITHESGFQPLSGYFVEGQATTYPIVIPEADLSAEQEARLEADLQKRWKGDFSMAGVRFWNEINDLPERLKQKTAGYSQVVSIFTNVIFDTTQMYANVLFRDMFAWLDELLEIMRAQPGTLFILRAHPDEARPGKTSRESVADWYARRGASLSNLVFIPPQERISSYDLVRASRFVLIYNSTIGLEATLLGVPVLAAGQAPFIAFDTVTFEPTLEAYQARLLSWLRAEGCEVPPERQSRTRRFLYYRTYRFSLPFSEFLEPSLPVGYVRLKKYPLSRLKDSSTCRALLGGVLEGKRFELDV